jgi:flagellar hook assembly protein FlgD
VRRIADGHHAAGIVRAQWDGEDELGRPVASGTYLVRVAAGERAEVQRVSVIR